MSSSNFNKSDGSLAFDAGVNSIKVTTIASQHNPTGLARNELAWLVNATVRDGGITQRYGWVRRKVIKKAEELYQGGFVYEPEGEFPYLMLSLGGVIYKTLLDGDYAVTNISSTSFVQPANPAIAAYRIVLKNRNISFPHGAVTSATVLNGAPAAPYGSPGTLTQDFPVPQKDAYGEMLMTQASTKQVGDVFNVTILGIVFEFEVLAVTKPNTIPTGGTNPADEPHAYFCQAERFLIVQAGDNITLPLIWDGNILTRSIGINDTVVTPGTPGVNQIPAATAMDYFMGRLWYAQGRQYSAGDIVGGDSGTIQYQFRDAVLNVTENPLVLGGDGFTVPSASGNIRALRHSANLDAALGQGRLFVFTAKEVYALNVPVTRLNWIAADNDNQPLQTVVQLVNGSVNDRCIVPVNGDLFYQSLEPGIRSLIQSVRYFTQWGNIEISANENRVLRFVDRGLMRDGASGIFFDNRMLQTTLPFQTPYGVASKGIIPMDVVPISSFGSQHPPNWEGLLEGLNIYQLFQVNYGGRDRAFAVVLSSDGNFELWELTDSSRTDLSENTDDGNRVQWIIEFPAFTWGNEFQLKKLVGSEIWVDRLSGTVEFSLQYRPDGQVCWIPWHNWKECSPRNSCEDAINPICYPLIPYSESYRSVMQSPVPDVSKCATATGRPANIAFQFQPRLVIKGFCRVRGIMLIAEEFLERMYDQLRC